MTKVQAANIISWLPIMPFLGKIEKVKSETKPEMGIMSQTSEAPRVPQMSEAPQVPQTSQMLEVPLVPETSQTSAEVPQVPQTSQTSEGPRVQEAPRVSEPQVTPMTPKGTQAEEIDLEKDAEASRKTIEPEKEPSPEVERTDSYQHYIMSGKGDTPEQKVNKVVKELNYHNMLVVIAVGDKTINNIGSIRMVAEKWGLSYSIIQRAISGIKEHC